MWELPVSFLLTAQNKKRKAVATRWQISVSLDSGDSEAQALHKLFQQRQVLQLVSPRRGLDEGERLDAPLGH